MSPPGYLLLAGTENNREWFEPDRVCREIVWIRAVLKLLLYHVALLLNHSHFCFSDDEIILYGATCQGSHVRYNNLS